MSVSISSYIQVISWFTPVAVAVLAMGAIAGEKSSGTAAWVLSAPVSRPGFLVSKLVGLAVGCIATMIVVPGVIGFLELTYLPDLANTGELAVRSWIAGNGVLALNVLFYASLTLTLGTVFSSRGPVIGIVLAVLFFGLLFGGALPEAVFNVTPWALTKTLVGELANETETVTSVAPVFVTTAWIAGLTAISFWRFQREEF